MDRSYSIKPVGNANGENIADDQMRLVHKAPNDGDRVLTPMRPAIWANVSQADDTLLLKSINIA